MATATNPSPIRVGIFGPDEGASNERHGGGLWAAGYAACVSAAGATPVSLGKTLSDRYWNEVLDGLHGLLLVGDEATPERRTVDGERLCEWCQEHRLPILGVDHGLHVLNSTFNGTSFMNLCKEQPEALQHRHPPEKGLRHAIMVHPGTRLAAIYGEGEVVVNSEHRRGVNKLAKGFRVSAQALDGVVEAIEATADNWFAMGVQWHPASTTASGLDIQVFRGLVTACEQRMGSSHRARCGAAA